MRVRLVCAILAALVWAGARARAQTPKAPAREPSAREAVVVAADDAPSREIAGVLAARLSLRRFQLSDAQAADPIAKGRLLAALQAAPLVVAVGEDATAFTLGELEDTPVYFVSPTAPGSALERAGVSGLLTYSPEDVLGALPERWKRGLGLLYTPGYEGVAAAVEAAARAQGARVSARRVAQRRDLPAAARALMSTTDAVWVLGDPLLSEGAGMSFLAELSLSRGVPLIGAGPRQVRAGAALCSQAKPPTIEREVEAAVSRRRASGAAGGVALSPAGGRLLFNEALRARFGLGARSGSREVPR